MPASKRTNSDSAAKQKQSRKRRKASVNFNPKSSRKKAIASSKNKEDHLDSDFIDVKDKTTKNEENESDLSSDEEIGRINETCQNNRTDILGSGIQRTLSRRQTPMSSQSNTLSSLSSTRTDSSQFTGISPKNPIENNLECGFQVQRDKNFIQQQVQLLTTAFTLQDCPALAGKQGRIRRNSIPQDVIHDALRKLHHKMDDEIQKHLNRQCQRKVLSELMGIENDAAVHENQDEDRENHVTETMSVFEILEKCSNDLDNHGDADPDLLRKYANSLAELQTLNDEMKKIRQSIAFCESNNLLVLEVESLAREKNEKSLQKEIERTKKLVKQVTLVLRGNANSA